MLRGGLRLSVNNFSVGTNPILVSGFLPVEEDDPYWNGFVTKATWRSSDAVLADQTCNVEILIDEDVL